MGNTLCHVYNFLRGRVTPKSVINQDKSAYNTQKEIGFPREKVISSPPILLLPNKNLVHKTCQQLSVSQIEVGIQQNNASKKYWQTQFKCTHNLDSIEGFHQILVN